MEESDPFLDLLQELSNIIAPVQWFLLILFFLIIFHRPLFKLIPKLKGIKIGDTFFGFGESDVDRVPQGPPPPFTPPPPFAPPTGEEDWSNAWDFFWLGHDLIWTINVVLRGAPGAVIRRGLHQSFLHLKELNLLNAEHIALRLGNLLREAMLRSEKNWTPEARNYTAVEIDAIIGLLKDLIYFHEAPKRPNKYFY
jgi:hypothetical protein